MEQSKVYAIQRIILGVLFVILSLWAISLVIGFFAKPVPTDTSHSAKLSQPEPAAHGETKAPPSDGHGSAPVAAPHAAAPALETPTAKTSGHGTTPVDKHAIPAPSAGGAHGTKSLHGASGSSATPLAKVSGARGVTFVAATISPLEYELKDRWWGWRPNDILDFTDNVNNYQLGVLEVTRRAVMNLAGYISRKGGNDEINKHCENAMNWLMIKPESYWFPSPESKFKDALDELKVYAETLNQGKAFFYTRPDNLIPLLQTFEDLMGSCEENLAKSHEKTGEEVSHFKADDHFYYAKGVAEAMGTIMEAVAEDFAQTVEPRRGSEILETIITECHHAKTIDPLYVTNADLSGFLANHRANLATRIAGARYALGLLIKNLST